MGNQQRLKLIDEIKNIERLLYLKISQLASSEEEHSSETDLSNLAVIDFKSTNLKNMFTTLIQNVGSVSTGGNSVDDINFERQL